MTTSTHPRLGALVLAFIHKAREQGLEFFDIAGHPLATEREILHALTRDHAIQRRRCALHTTH